MLSLAGLHVLDKKIKTKQNIKRRQNNKKTLKNVKHVTKKCIKNVQNVFTPFSHTTTASCMRRNVTSFRDCPKTSIQALVRPVYLLKFDAVLQTNGRSSEKYLFLSLDKANIKADLYSVMKPTIRNRDFSDVFFRAALKCTQTRFLSGLCP